MLSFSLSTTGTTRVVVVLFAWALKFARGERGRRCNKYEQRLFGSVDERRRAMLCPVRWCSTNGSLLVMTAASPLTEAERDRLLLSDGFPVWDYRPGEADEPHKASDWGWLQGRLVALDYSTPAHITRAEINEMVKSAWGN